MSPYAFATMAPTDRSPRCPIFTCSLDVMFSLMTSSDRVHHLTGPVPMTRRHGSGFLVSFDDCAALVALHIPPRNVVSIHAGTRHGRTIACLNFRKSTQAKADCVMPGQRMGSFGIAWTCRALCCLPRALGW